MNGTDRISAAKLLPVPLRKGVGGRGPLRSPRATSTAPSPQPWAAKRTRPARGGGGVWLVLLLLLPIIAVAQPAQIGIRAGNHPGFGRLVFDMPSGTQYRLSRAGDRVTVHFNPELPLGHLSALPSNVLALTGDAKDAVVQVAPGATMHDMRLGDHVVLDVFDPAAPARPEPARQPQAPEPARARTGHPAMSPPAKRHAAAAGLKATAPAEATAAKPAASSALSAKPTMLAPLRQPAKSMGAAKPAASAAPSAKPATPDPLRQPAKSMAAAKPAAFAAPSAKPATPEPLRQPAKSVAAAKPAAPATPPVAPVTFDPLREPAKSPAAAAATPPPGGHHATASAIPPAQSQIAEPQPPAAEEPAAPAGSLGLVATLVPPPAGMQGTAFLLPFPEPVGAAAFRRGDIDYVVFDEPRPLDLRALRHDKLLWSASVHLLPAATLVRLRLPPGMTIRLSPAPQGWVVAAVTNPPRLAPIEEHVGQGRLLLSAAQAGKVITVADAATGATLLVGTQDQPGQAVAIRRRGSEFTLLPSWQGVLVEALSDCLTLRRTSTGFVLGTEPGTLAVSPLDGDALTEAATLTRRFRFADLPPEMLRQRIARGLQQAAAAASLARGPLRQAIARDMIAAGLEPEAEALLRVAMQEDPKQAASADTAALAAIAALLADRPADADAIADPLLSGSDEVTFWRAVRLAAADDASPQAAAGFAATAPLALDYPPAMRDKLLPLVLETMLRGGRAEAAQALLARCGKQPGLPLARAMADEAAGKADAALQAYDALTRNADRMASAHAATRALELRLKLGRITVQQAADGLDNQLFAWRGDRHDLDVRERLAALRQQSGAWRAALAALRGAEQDFPEQRLAILARMRSVFASLLRDGAVDRLPPVELVALVDENADLLPASADGEALLAHLADRLLALDLPDRAGPVLEKLMRAAPTATGRAGFGARLAAMRLHEGDAAGSLQALLASAASGLPPDLAQRRLLLFAAATARRGDVSAALASLSNLHSAAAAAARADITEQAQDWWGADRALTEYVDRTVPAAGTLDDRQRQALLHLATAAARAGDDATLAGLNARESARMGSGALADMFHLLTAPPVRHPSDLRRARQEAGLASALPADLKAVQPAVPTH